MRKIFLITSAALLLAIPFRAQAASGTVNLASPTGTVGMGTDGTNLLNIGILCGTTSSALYGTCINQAEVNSSGQILTLDSQTGTWNITNISGTISLPTGAATSAFQEVTAAGTSSTSAQGVQGVTGGVPMPISATAAGLPLPSGAATSNNQEVTAAGTSSASAQGVQGVTGGVPMPVSGSVTNVGFTPSGVYQQLSVTTTSSSIALTGPPAVGSTIVVYNNGFNQAFVTLGGSSVTATNADDLIPPYSQKAYTIGTGQTYLAAVTKSAGQTAGLNISQGTGYAADTGGPINTAVAPLGVTTGAVDVIGGFDNSLLGRFAQVTATGTSATDYALGIQGETGGVPVASNINTWGGTAITNVPTAVGTAGTGNTPTVNAYIVGGGGGGGTSSNYGSTFPTLGTAAGFEYLTSAPTLTNGQMVAGQTDINGNLKVNVVSGGGTNASVGSIGSGAPLSGTYAGMLLSSGALAGVSGSAWGSAPSSLNVLGVNANVLSAVLPSNAATASNQEVTAAGTTATSAQGVQGVTGGVPMPVSAAALPLPSGAATSAFQEVTVAGTSSTSAQGVQGVTGGVPMAANINTWGGTAITNTPTSVGTVGTGTAPTVNAYIVGGAGGGTASSFNSTFPTTGTASGYEYLSTPPTYTTSGQMVAPQVNANGSTLVDILSSGNLYSALTAGSGTQGTTAPTQGVQVGGEYLSSAPTLTTGQFGNLQLDSSGNLKVYLNGCAASGSPCNANGSATSANSSPVVIASDQAAVATKAASGAYVAGSIADLAHGSATAANSVPTVSNVMSHASTTALGTSLVAKASAGNLGAYNCTAITGGAAGYCIVYNGTTAPSTGALTGANVLDFCYFATGAAGCSLTRLPNTIAFSSGIVVLITSAVSPYTYTTGTDTGAIEADYF